jgi:cysteinyl-tRNA synthetase
MAKQSTGFTTTIPNFSNVIDILVELGVDWNPINTDLSIPQLKARHAAAKLVMDAYKSALEFDKIKTSEREAAYLRLNSLVQRILAAANACKMGTATIEDVATYKGLIDGGNISKLAAKKDAALKRAAKKTFKLTGIMPEKTDATEEEDKRTVSRMAYALRYDNFENLITLLTTAGTYKTNVADLSIDALNAYLDRLAAANKATNDADKAWSTAVDARNAALCGKTGSICSTVADIKAELVSMETKSGPTYKKVLDIKFMQMQD